LIQAKMKTLSIIVAVFLLISIQTMCVYALELPPDLVVKLHANLRVAFLNKFVGGYGYVWVAEYEVRVL
jgi:hypothetical protein